MLLSLCGSLGGIMQKKVLDASPSNLVEITIDAEGVSYGYSLVPLIGGFHFMYDDLKTLVEAWELVESYGGINGARKEAHKDCFAYPKELLKAINLVEQVND
jgi:hypothetical protein